MSKVVFVRLTWGHRGQRSQGTKVSSGILETRSPVGSCTVWGWLLSEGWVGALPVHCGGCSRALGFGMLGNAERSLAR